MEFYRVSLRGKRKGEWNLRSEEFERFERKRSRVLETFKGKRERVRLWIWIEYWARH